MVKVHLSEDIGGRGVVINREVEIRRRRGLEPGQETDLYVSAIAPGDDEYSYRAVTVIVEVKGCWNREVKTAMREQLVERYLADSGCQHGLYLVGWFNCAQWDQQDSRWRDAQKLGSTLEEATAKFDEQARQLSYGGRRVRARVLNIAL